MGIICGACKGGCCRAPVYVHDDFTKTLHRNTIYYDSSKNRTFIRPHITSIDGLACYFRSRGGCPQMIKPDECKIWYCSIYDELVLGKIRKPIVGLTALIETIEIFKLLND